MKIFELLFSIIFFLILSLLNILNFLINIRIGTIDFPRIGGIYYLDWYLSEKKIRKENSIDLFLYSDKYKQSNTQWLKMWKKKVILLDVPHIFLRSLNKINKYKLNNFITNIPINIKYPEIESFFKTKSKSLILEHNKRLNYVLQDQQSNIHFTQSDIKKGKEFLKSIGVNYKKYICIHNRDNKYLNKRFPENNWSYHDYRDFKINDFELTVRYLIDKGFFVIRVGSEVSDQLKFNDKNYFDYSTSKYQSDFLDIFLLGNCYFLISSDSGISAISEVFNIPIVYVNKTLLNEIHRWSSNCRFIFKKFYSNKFNRFLKFEEIWKLKIGDLNHIKRMNEKKINIINNSPEEIKEVTREMVDFLEFNNPYSKDEEMIQNEFWNIFAPNKIRSKNCRIGKGYLYNNKKLL